MPNRDCKIEQLLLDQENPRHPPVGSQRDALRAILLDQDEKLYRLADSIAGQGLNPLERLLVLKQGAKFVVLEGNRRLAAIRIIANPNILSGMELAPSLQRRFETLAKNFRPADIEPIGCFVVPDRETAASWIQLRHTGENEGRGVVNWSALQTARFKGGDPASQALDFVRKYGNLAPEEMSLLGTDFPITTLDRLLSAVPIRRRLGIEIKNKKLRSGLPADELMKPLRKMALDLGSSAINVSDVKNTEQQVAYLDTFSKADLPDTSKTGDMRTIESIEGGEFKSKASSTPRQQKIHDPSNRSTVVPRNSRLNVTSTKIAQILAELRSLKIDKYPHAVAVLTRVFLELSVDHHLDASGSSTQYRDAKSGKALPKKLKAKVQEVIGLLETQQGMDPRKLRPVERALTKDDSPLNIDLLHDYIHNNFSLPKRKDLLGAWDEAIPLFQSIWK